MGAKKQLELTEHAFRNIAAAEEYIAKDSQAAAQKVAKVIYSTAEKLESRIIIYAVLHQSLQYPS